ncbi:MAG: RidA family protein [Betaproteobacteria bacterium]|nr:RidA family protein [Betaproteobacteria bacterium]
MTIRKIVSPHLAEPPDGIYSNCLMVGDQIFISGMTARGADGQPTGGSDMYLQAKACMEKIRIMLEAAGACVADVVKMTVYVTDMGKRPEFGRARNEFFPEPRPCSTMIEIKGLAGIGCLIEIDVTAIRNASNS